MRVSCKRRNSPNDTTFMVSLTITHKTSKVNIFLVVLLILYILYIRNNENLYHSLYELYMQKTEGRTYVIKHNISPAVSTNYNYFVPE